MQQAIQDDSEFATVLFAFKMSMMEIFRSSWEMPNKYHAKWNGGGDVEITEPAASGSWCGARACAECVNTHHTQTLSLSHTHTHSLTHHAYTNTHTIPYADRQTHTHTHKHTHTNTHPQTHTHPHTHKHTHPHTQRYAQTPGVASVNSQNDSDMNRRASVPKRSHFLGDDDPDKVPVRERERERERESMCVVNVFLSV